MRVSGDAETVLLVLFLRGHGQLSPVAGFEQPDLDEHPAETPHHRGEGDGVTEAVMGLVAGAVLQAEQRPSQNLETRAGGVSQCLQSDPRRFHQCCL